MRRAEEDIIPQSSILDPGLLRHKSEGTLERTTFRVGHRYWHHHTIHCLLLCRSGLSLDLWDVRETHLTAFFNSLKNNLCLFSLWFSCCVSKSLYLNPGRKSESLPLSSFVHTWIINHAVERPFFPTAFWVLKKVLILHLNHPKKCYVMVIMSLLDTQSDNRASPGCW